MAAGRLAHDLLPESETMVAPRSAGLKSRLVSSDHIWCRNTYQAGVEICGRVFCTGGRGGGGFAGPPPSKGCRAGEVASGRLYLVFGVFIYHCEPNCCPTKQIPWQAIASLWVLPKCVCHTVLNLKNILYRRTI